MGSKLEEKLYQRFGVVPTPDEFHLAMKRRFGELRSNVTRSMAMLETDKVIELVTLILKENDVLGQKGLLHYWRMAFELRTDMMEKGNASFELFPDPDAFLHIKQFGMSLLDYLDIKQKEGFFTNSTKGDVLSFETFASNGLSRVAIGMLYAWAAAILLFIVVMTSADGFGTLPLLLQALVASGVIAGGIGHKGIGDVEPLAEGILSVGENSLVNGSAAIGRKLRSRFKPLTKEEFPGTEYRGWRSSDHPKWNPDESIVELVDNQYYSNGGVSPEDLQKGADANNTTVDKYERALIEKNIRANLNIDWVKEPGDDTVTVRLFVKRPDTMGTRAELATVADPYNKQLQYDWVIVDVYVKLDDLQSKLFHLLPGAPWEKQIAWHVGNFNNGTYTTGTKAVIFGSRWITNRVEYGAFYLIALEFWRNPNLTFWRIRSFTPGEMITSTPRGFWNLQAPIIAWSLYGIYESVIRTMQTVGLGLELFSVVKHDLYEMLTPGDDWSSLVSSGVSWAFMLNMGLPLVFHGATQFGKSRITSFIEKKGAEVPSDVEGKTIREIVGGRAYEILDFFLPMDLGHLTYKVFSATTKDIPGRKFIEEEGQGTQDRPERIRRGAYRNLGRERSPVSRGGW
jgi:hypothetical protein